MPFLTRIICRTLRKLTFVDHTSRQIGVHLKHPSDQSGMGHEKYAGPAGTCRIERLETETNFDRGSEVTFDGCQCEIVESEGFEGGGELLLEGEAQPVLRGHITVKYSGSLDVTMTAADLSHLRLGIGGLMITAAFLPRCE
jgi:hypothetical protein